MDCHVISNPAQLARVQCWEELIVESACLRGTWIESFQALVLFTQSQANWQRDSRVLAKLGFMFVHPSTPFLCSCTILAITGKLVQYSAPARLYMHPEDLNTSRLATIQLVHERQWEPRT